MADLRPPVQGNLLHGGRFETQRAEYVYNTDSVNFEGSDEDKAKVKVENSTATEGFVADENGHVTGLKVVNVAPGENGPFTRQPGTERVIPADLVLISVGFLHPDTPRWWISCRSTLTVEAMWRVTTSSPPPRTRLRLR